MIDPAIKHQIPRAILAYRIHERIGDQHRQVEHPQPRRIGFGGDEGLDIRVITAHRRHHRAATASGGHDGAAHRIPHIHKAERATGIRRDAKHLGALGADGAEIITDAAALLHGQRSLAQVVENPAHVIGHRAHDETVEHGHLASGARPGGDPPGGQEFEILKRLVKPLFPGGRIALDLGQSARDAPPGIFDRQILCRAIRRLETVFHIPDLFGDRGGKTCHAGDSYWLGGDIP